MDWQWSTRITLVLLGAMALALCAGVLALDALLGEPQFVLRAVAALLFAVAGVTLAEAGRRAQVSDDGAAGGADGSASRRTASAKTASS